LLTYTGTTKNVPSTGEGNKAILTVGEIVPIGSQVSPHDETVIGNTTFTFTQVIPGDAPKAQATAFLVWGDKAKSDPIGYATFTTPCPVLVPDKPAPEVVVTPTEDKNCDSKTITTTTITTTTGWDLIDNVWVKGQPVSKTVTTTRAATAQECPVLVPDKSAPEVVVNESAPEVVLSAESEVAAAGSTAEAVNPLPVGAAAGQANTSGYQVVGGFAAFAGVLMLGLGTILRRRRVEV